MPGLIGFVSRPSDMILSLALSLEYTCRAKGPRTGTGGAPAELKFAVFFVIVVPFVVHDFATCF